MMQTPSGANLERRAEYRLGPGASSLLMIFVSLCMTTVGILTLISAIADTRLTDRSQKQVTSYYSATVEVQRSIGAIDAALETYRKTSVEEEGYKQAVLSMHEEAPEMSAQMVDDNTISVRFNQPMGEDFVIHVDLHVPISLEGPRYQVVAHEMSNISKWDMGSDRLNVYQDPDFDIESMDFSEDFSEDGEVEFTDETEEVEFE